MKMVQDRANAKALGESLIIKTAVRFMVPFAQLFGLYVIAHGHYSPGGGFQGGVVLGSSFIMLALAFGLRTSLRRFSESVNALCGNIGVLIYAGTGFLCALVGGLFLDYAALAAIIPIDPVEWRSLGVFIVEVGVGLTVMSIMASLYWDIGSGGSLEEGL